MQVKFPVLVLAVAAFAWTAAAQTNTSPSGQASSNTATASGGATINAVLDKSIDAKKAKVGELVEANTTADAMTAGTMIPRGSKLIGHVTEARPHEKGSASAPSSLGIQFDQAEIKGGQQVPIHAVIQAIAAPQQSAPIGTTPDMTAGGGGYGQGGYGQGGYGTTAGTMPRAGVPGQTTPTPSAPMGGIGTSGSQTNTGAATNGPSGGGQLSPNMTGVLGIKDLKLESGSAQASVITSDNKNVKLDSGTQLLLRVTAQ